MSDPFVGEIRMVPFSFEPNGWAFCNGQLLSISTHTALFSLLGVAYGGNGVSTFGLPDMRQRAPIHYGDGPGLTPYTWGQSGGQAGITLTPDQTSHSHTLAATPEAATLADPTGDVLAQVNSSLGNIYHSATNMVAMHTSTSRHKYA